MRSLFISLAATFVLLLSGPIASAQQDLVETVVNGSPGNANSRFTTPLPSSSVSWRLSPTSPTSAMRTSTTTVRE